MTKFIALLPMKENSERVPQKNYRELAGKPLFFYIADSLKKTKCFEKLIINTDSDKISNMAINRYENWVQIHERPKALCGDFVSMNQIIKHDIIKFDENFHFFQTHSTNPFLTESVIKNAVSLYENNVLENKFDSVFSVNELKTRLYDKDIKSINHNPDELIRTQDLDTIYEENSNFYIFNSHSFKLTNGRIGKRPIPFIMESNRIESLDIDDPKDWAFAEELINGGRICFE
jgi:CMP-N-acetylneuraminic acid synthetase